MVAVSATDAIIGLDSEAIGINSSDSASGSETSQVNVNVTDTASASETNSRVATFTKTDSVSSSESQSIQILGGALADSDTAHSAETFSIVATLPVQTDSGSGTESQSVTLLKSSTDTSSSVETISISSVSDWSAAVSGTTPGTDVLDTLVLGPATIYVGDYGALEPTDRNVVGPPSSDDWTDIGSTLGGVTVTLKQEYESPELMQIPTRAASRMKKRDVQVKTELAEPTISNFLLILNEGTIDEGTEYTSFTPLATVDEAIPPTYRAIIIDGWAPNFNSNGQHKRRRIIMRKCLSIEGSVTNYSDNKQTTQGITWSAHYVDGTISSIKIIDEI